MKGSPEVCTAVLVRPDMIATTSHCLRPKGRLAQPNQLVFTPSAAGPQVRGAALVAEGGSVAPGSIKPNQAQTDWALVRITPPLSGIRPLPLSPLSPAMVRAKIAGGAQFYSAGYGQGAKDELRTHKGCGLLPPDPDGVTEGALFFATDCVIRLGDSGGPVILIEGRAAEADRPHRRLLHPAQERRVRSASWCRPRRSRRTSAGTSSANCSQSTFRRKSQ